MFKWHSQEHFKGDDKPVLGPSFSYCLEGAEPGRNSEGGVGTRHPWVQAFALSVVDSVKRLVKLLNLSKPQFPHL